VIKDWRLKISVLMLLALQFSCTESPKPVVIKKLAHPNPTSYTFDFPVDKLRDKVINLFSIDPQTNDSILKVVFIDRILKEHPFQINFVAETSDKAAFGTDYYKNVENSDDIFLFSMGSYWYSPLYFRKNNEPFLFFTSFAFKFKAISDQKTLLSVIDINPIISNGTKCCGHSGYMAIEEKVQPTTVEEYTLILYIAEKLGVRGLAPLRLPK
jgi:hypothetical protein